MSNTVICLLAILVVLFVSWKFNVQAGALGAFVAMVIGTLLLKLNANKVIGFWPIGMIFYMTIITFFYGFAQQNGTLEVLAKKMMRMIKGKGALIIPMVCVLCIILGFAGAQPIPIAAPLVFAIGATAGINPLALVIVLSAASEMGSGNPLTGGGGIISAGLIRDAGFANWNAMSYGVWLGSAFKHLIFIIFVYFFFKCYKAKSATNVMDEPAPEFTPVQRKNMGIIVGCMLFAIVFQLLPTIIKGVPFLNTMKGIADANIVFTFGILLCILLKVGDTRKALKFIPNNTIITVGGMTMLMKVAAEAGMVKDVAAIIQGNVPAFLIPGALVLFAGFMSFFAGGVSVVCPMLYPLVPALAASTGHNALMLFICIFVGAMATAISPFSTAGAQLLGCMLDEETQAKNYMPMMVWAVIGAVAFAILASLGLFNIFNGFCVVE